MAESLGKNPAAVLVRWAIQHGTSGALTVSFSTFWCSALHRGNATGCSVGSVLNLLHQKWLVGATGSQLP